MLSDAESGDCVIEIISDDCARSKNERDIVFVLFFTIIGQLNAQNTQVRIKLTDKNGKPFSLALVLYYPKAKSTETFNIQKAKKITVDSLGIAELNVDTAKKYLFRSSWVGYQMTDTILNFATQNEQLIILKESNSMLNEVVVKSNKPLIRQEDDKSVVDPEPLAEVVPMLMKQLKKFQAYLLTRMATFI
jgi:hypothetical protein